MNVIAIDLTKLKPEVVEALKTRCVREGKTMQSLLAELIERTNDMILDPAQKEVGV